jgi:shikimate dehydrogenase
MLLYQGTAQFEIWTGKEAPVEVMRQTLMESLEDETDKDH